jgi:hypothetical protein
MQATHPPGAALTGIEALVQILNRATHFATSDFKKRKCIAAPKFKKLNGLIDRGFAARMRSSPRKDP